MAGKIIRFRWRTSSRFISVCFVNYFFVNVTPSLSVLLFLFSQGEAFVSLNIAKKRGVDSQRFFLIFNSNTFNLRLQSFPFILILLCVVVFFALYKLTILCRPPQKYKLILIVLEALTALPHVFFLTIKRLHNPFAVNEVKNSAILDFIAQIIATQSNLFEQKIKLDSLSCLSVSHYF